MKKIFLIIWLTLLIGQGQLVRAQSPGGVPGQTLWLKADAQSYGDNTPINGTTKWVANTGISAGQYAANLTPGGSSPVFKTGAWNFNPVIRFNKGAIGADYGSGASITTFTVSNFKGAASIQGVDESRVFSMTGGTQADPFAGSLIPLLGANPIRAYIAGVAADYVSGGLNGSKPGIACGMKTGASSANGNTVNNLLAQWNGAAGNNNTSTNSLSIDYYVLGGKASGSKGIANSGFFTGDIPEVIVYSTDLSANSRRKINSYLAIKYGITLDQSGGGKNYLNSAGTIIWTGNATYTSNIAAIGRDDNSALYQKQSKSINPGKQVLIGVGNLENTNALNNGTLANNQFLIWGDNGLSKTLSVSISGIAGVSQRLAAVWKVQNTGSVGTVRVAWPRQIGIINSKLVQNTTDATFTSGNVVTDMSGNTITINGIVYNYADVTLLDGSFFTIAGLTTGPGGVTGQALWLKADTQLYDDDDTIDSTNNWEATSGNSAGQYALTYSSGVFPVFKKGAWNFNPIVRFNLGAIGADYTNAGSAITTFTTINYTGSTNGLGGGGSRSFSMGGAASDNAPGSLIPLLQANPMMIWNSNSTQTAAYTASVLNGVNPGIACGMATPGSPSAGNTANALLAQWNGSTGNIKTGVTNSFGINYYVLGGMASGAKNINPTQSFVNADIPEVVVYNTDLTATQRHKVNSYMAIKYGITLDQTVSASGQSYLNSAGSAIWTGNSTYVNDITGIGRDDASALNQKQSMSINSTGLVVLGLGSIAADNAANTNAFAADNSFEIWGADNGSTAFVTYFPYGQVTQRMACIWKVQETGTVGTVQVAIPASAVPAGLSNLNLLVSASATFNGTATRLPMTLQTINGTQYYATTVDFANGQYFTFGAYQSPNNILINPTRGSRFRAQ